VGYCRLRWIIVGYSGLQQVTVSYGGLQQVTGYSSLQWVKVVAYLHVGYGGLL